MPQVNFEFGHTAWDVRIENQDRLVATHLGARLDLFNPTDSARTGDEHPHAVLQARMVADSKLLASLSVRELVIIEHGFRVAGLPHEYGTPYAPNGDPELIWRVRPAKK